MIKLNYKVVLANSVIPEFHIGQCRNCRRVFIVPSDLQMELWDNYDIGLDPHRDQLNCCSNPEPLWVLDILSAEKEDEPKPEASPAP